ncbi:MAG: Asp-tRNA(Asn)/Glu-tRNA(Gln) amidotransferase subunit GatC [Deltaproteobacteria bacterium]|nr:Asp-tRNA(Asn)/Glu-tRNA(Gln) amidotransferase subunit GatC [Deltaproteobacteria bacterium]
MPITRKEVQRTATLARLTLTATEEDELIDHFTKILHYMETLKTLKTETIDPTAHAIAVPSLLRDDSVTNQAAPDALLANAPAREDHFFKVPKVLD